MNVLVVCELNFARSVTTSYLLKRKAKKENLNLKIKSAGFFTRNIKRNHLENILYFSKKYLPFIPKKEITKEKIEWADTIIVMEEYMKDKINGKNVICLDIPSRYWFPYSPKLIRLIEKKLKEINFYQSSP